MDTGGNFYLGIRLPVKYGDKPKTKKERVRVNASNWKENNPNKYKAHLEYVKQWKRDNKDRVKQTQRNWYERNRRKMLEYYRDYNRKKDRKHDVKVHKIE